MHLQRGLLLLFGERLCQLHMKPGSLRFEFEVEHDILLLIHAYGVKIVSVLKQVYYLLIAIFAHCVQKFTNDVRPVHFDNDELSQTPRPIPLES
jgi:hypothetical protein